MPMFFLNIYPELRDGHTFQELQISAGYALRKIKDFQDLIINNKWEDSEQNQNKYNLM
jgi:hypothetical protein